MRNLKRVLSLGLASVMLMGMMVTGAGAANKDFSDAADIDNVEAVDVMVALGILEGTDKGEFLPDSILTREQAAKIICSMLLGPENADKLSTTGVTFSDVAADRWSAPYIAYCVNMGILAGDGTGKFLPEAQLDGASFAKMLLVALGYDAGIEKYVGSDWMVNVATDALAAGIVPQGMVMTEKVSRQDAAQMALMTLEATLVEYENKGSSIDLGNGVIINQGASKAKAVTYISANGYDYTTGANDAAAGDSVEFCEKYFKDLSKIAGDPDDFGRLADYQWTLDGDKVYNATEKPVVTFTGKQDGDDIAKALKGYSFVNASGAKEKIQNDTNVTGTFTAKLAGQNNGLGTGTGAFGTWKIENTTTAAKLATATGEGKLVEVYANDQKEITGLVTVTYTVGEATKVSTNKDGDVAYTIGGSTYTDYADPDKADTAKVSGEVAEDDIVTYVKIGDVAYVYPTTSFVGAQSAKSSNTITVSGTKYDVALDVSGVNMTKFNNSKDEANYYVDQFGYVVYTDAVAAETNYAIVDKIALVGATGTAGSQSVEAVLVFADGTTKTVDVSKINGYETKKVTNDSVSVSTNTESAITELKLSSNVNSNNALTGMVVTYTEKDGKYELTYETMKASLSNKSAATDIFGNYESCTSGAITTKGVPAVATDATTANNTTKYLVKTDDDKFAAYTGFKNVPTITAETNAVTISFVEDGSIAEFVYIDASQAKNVGDTTTGDIFYVTNTNYTETLVGDDTVFELTGVLNGEVATIKMEDKKVVGTSSKSEMTKNTLYELDVDNDGYVTAAKPQGSGTAYVNEIVKTEAKDGVIVVNSDSKIYTYDDGTKVIVIDGEDVINDTIAAADAGETVYIKTVGDKGADAIAIEVIYIINK